MPEVNGLQSKTQVRAKATRARVIRAAFELFCQVGYRATTMQGVADKAGVAVQTVYFTFGRKDDLLQAVHEWTVLGDNPVPPDRQGWYVAAMRAATAPEALPLLLTGIATINALVAPMLPVFHAVAQDPAGQTYARAVDLRRTGMLELIRTLAAKSPLVSGMTMARAADLLFFLTGPECYRELVLLTRWTTSEWIEWVATTLSRDVFGASSR